MLSTKSDISDSSKDQIRISRFIEPFDSILRERKIYTTKPFISLLKDHSKITNAPKCTRDQKLINKQHIYELVQFLISNSNCKFAIKIREFNRSAIEIKEKVFTYFASEYPELMHMASKDNFKSFQFSKYLYDTEVLVLQWNQYINDIQKTINQTKIDLFTPITENFYDNSFTEFLEMNDDIFPYEFNENELSFQLNQSQYDA